jgi:quercetin dioxygenase-like cupin family protein
MAVIREIPFRRLADFDDPDDYRLESRIAFVVDERPGTGPFVDGMAAIVEEIAPGERIPLHTHTIDEVVFVVEGEGELTLGDERHRVAPPAIVFIPAGTPHGTRAVGDELVRIHAVFPSRVIDLTYLERNPAPGTEDEPPHPPVAVDVRALVEGRLDEAIRPFVP